MLLRQLKTAMVALLRGDDSAAAEFISNYRLARREMDHDSPALTGDWLADVLETVLKARQLEQDK